MATATEMWILTGKSRPSSTLVPVVGTILCGVYLSAMGLDGKKGNIGSQLGAGLKGTIVRFVGQF